MPIKPPWHPSRFCRPPNRATAVHRFDGVGWAPDNGKPGIAFSYKIDNTPYGGVVGDTSFLLDEALGNYMTYTASRFGCANGRQLPPWTAQ